MNPDRVRLRDVVLADADLIDSWESPAIRGEFNDFGEPPGPMPRDVLAAGPLRNDHNGMLVVELIAERTAIGTIGWHRVMNGPNPESAAWNIGISLIPEARGQGYGTEAQRQVAAYLFETTSRTLPSSDPWRRRAIGVRGSSAARSTVPAATTT
jgi:RimJ/RimL family protein N-acetyltransferase